MDAEGILASLQGTHTIGTYLCLRNRYRKKEIPFSFTAHSSAHSRCRLAVITTSLVRFPITKFLMSEANVGNFVNMSNAVFTCQTSESPAPKVPKIYPGRHQPAG